MTALPALTADTFDAHIASGVAVVDLWATWCGPCRQVAPILETLAGEYVGRAAFAAVDVDAHPEVAARLNVSGVPTVAVFHDGELVASITGARPKAVYAAAIDEVLHS